MEALPASGQMQRRVGKRKMWREVATTTEGPKYKNHTATLVGHRILVFGGYDGRGNHNDVYEFDCLQRRWRKAKVQGEPPKGRNGHTATYAENKIFIVGGWLGSGPLAASDLHILETFGDMLRWRNVPLRGDAPGPCNMHTTDFVPERRSLFVFRGGDGRQYLNDLHLLNIDTFEWSQPEVRGTKPEARANHSSALVGRKLYVFGGWDGRQRLNDIHILDTGTLEWSSPKIHGHPPSPRAGMTFTCVRDKIYLFGGSGPQAMCYKDLQVFDPSTNTWLLVTEGREGGEDAGLEEAYPNMHRAPNGGLTAKGAERGAGSGGASHGASNGGEGLGGRLAGAEDEYGRSGLPGLPESASPSFDEGRQGLSGLPAGDAMRHGGGNPNSVSLRADMYVVGKGPSERAGHTATLVGNKLVIFGGSCVDEYLHDMSMLDVDEPPVVRVEACGGPLHRLRAKLGSYVDSPAFSDVTFLVEGRKVRASKLALALTSERFELMFRPREDGLHFKEAEEREICIDDVPYDVFRLMIEYLYTGVLRLPFSSAACVADEDGADEGRAVDPSRPQGLVDMYVSDRMHALSIMVEVESSPVEPNQDPARMRFLQNMLVCADRFMLDHLKQLCERELAACLSQATASELEYTALETNAAQLHAVCQHYQRQLARSADGAGADSMALSSSLILPSRSSPASIASTGSDISCAADAGSSS